MARRRLQMRDAWKVVDGAGTYAWAFLGLVVLCVAASLGLGYLGWLVLPSAFAVVFGVLAAPAVGWLERRRMRRTPATALVFAGIAVAVIIAVWAVVPAFVDQASRLASGVPDALDRLARNAGELGDRIGASNPAAADAVAGFEEGLNDAAVGFADGLSSTLFDIVALSFSVVVAGLLGTLVAFLAVKDLPSYRDPVSGWLDRQASRRLAGALRQMRRTVTMFIRGQLLLALIVGVLSGTALALLGVPYPIPLGVISAIGELIPTVGPILAAIPAVVFAAADSGALLALFAALALLGVQQLESYLFVPLVVGGAVELPPLVVLVALTIAGGTFGIPGMIVAVPLVASVRDCAKWWFMPPGEVEIEYAKLTGATPG